MGEWCYRNGGTEFCVFQLSLLSPFWTFKTSDHKQFFCIYPHLLLLLGWKKEGNRSPVPRQGMSNIGPTGWMWPSEAHYFPPHLHYIWPAPDLPFQQHFTCWGSGMTWEKEASEGKREGKSQTNRNERGREGQESPNIIWAAFSAVSLLPWPSSQTISQLLSCYEFCSRSGFAEWVASSIIGLSYLKNMIKICTLCLLSFAANGVLLYVRTKCLIFLAIICLIAKIPA